MEKLAKTYHAKANEVRQEWFLVDANNKILGRLASNLATILRGKHKAEFTPHVDTGDYLVIINAGKVKLTGKKLKDKIYYHSTGTAGGLKQINAYDLLKKHPTKLLEKAVKGMLPKGPLGYSLLKKIKIFAGDDHNHHAQKPKLLEL